MVEILSLNNTEDLLKKNNIEVIPRKKIKSKKDIEEFIEKYEPPVVIKGFSSKYSHKTEHNLIYLDVCNSEKAWAQYKELTKIAEEVYIEKEIKGREFYISFKKDVIFGEVIGFGKGGIDIELYKDISFRLLPLNKKEIKELISSTNYGKYLIENKFRDIKIEPKRVIEEINKLQQLYLKHKFLEFEINPLIINNKGTWVVDVKGIKIKNNKN